MGLRINVGIHPHRKDAALRRCAARAASNFSSLALSTLNSRIAERSARSISCASLPTPEKTTFFAALPVCRQHALQLAAGDDVEPGAQPGQQLQDRQIRVRLHRVTNGVFAAR